MFGRCFVFFITKFIRNSNSNWFTIVIIIAMFEWTKIDSILIRVARNLYLLGYRVLFIQRKKNAKFFSAGWCGFVFMWLVITVELLNKYYDHHSWLTEKKKKIPFVFSEITLIQQIVHRIHWFCWNKTIHPCILMMCEQIIILSTNYVHTTISFDVLYLIMMNIIYLLISDHRFLLLLPLSALFLLFELGYCQCLLIKPSEWLVATDRIVCVLLRKELKRFQNPPKWIYDPMISSLDRCFVCLF